METGRTRIFYLDNIRNLLVYNVVLYHAICVFAWPVIFFWPVLDRGKSSRLYETAICSMSLYLIPCLLFIAALFIFPSLNKRTPLQYLKKRFLRLYVPVIVFLFCAGDICPQLLLTRLNDVAPVYRETFLSYWLAFANMPAVYLSSSERTLNGVFFNFLHTWFLTLLFFLTMIVVLASLPFRGKGSEPKQADSRRRIIVTTIIFAVALGLFYVTGLFYYLLHGYKPATWIIIGKAASFMTTQGFVLFPLFLFGLYVYKKKWLARGNFGSWRLWGGLAAVFLASYVLLLHFGLMPATEEYMKVGEYNRLHDHRIPLPVMDHSGRLSALGAWFLEPLACVFLLLFLLSFARRFLNRPNEITAFCSKHSINVYILHLPLVLILQDAFLNVPMPPIVKIVSVTILAIAACLWLSHRLVYPHPKTAIAFFVALKAVALAAGFAFYSWAILVLIFTSFCGATYEWTRYLIARRLWLASA